MYYHIVDRYKEKLNYFLDVNSILLKISLLKICNLLYIETELTVLTNIGNLFPVKFLLNV